jgi:3-oxoacyl-[acyl-carrier protein] reductase
MNPKLVLVSGGSRGLGAHLVTHFLESGHAVGTFARSRTPLMDELAERFPGRFEFFAADAGDLPSLTPFVDRLIERHGAIHALVNNAAIGQDHLLVHTPPDMIERIIATNVTAPILLTRLVLKRMLLQSEGGRVLNITSICGLKGYNGLTVYSATKGAMDAFTRSLAHETSGRGILVNAVAPGFFESEMSSVLSPDQLDTIKRRTPTRQLTTDAQLLPVVDLLLFSDTNITGQTIAVDGGVTS